MHRFSTCCSIDFLYEIDDSNTDFMKSNYPYVMQCIECFHYLMFKMRLILFAIVRCFYTEGLYCKMMTFMFLYGFHILWLILNWWFPYNITFLTFFEIFLIKWIHWYIRQNFAMLEVCHFSIFQIMYWCYRFFHNVDLWLRKFMFYICLFVYFLPFPMSDQMTSWLEIYWCNIKESLTKYLFLNSSQSDEYL